MEYRIFIKDEEGRKVQLNKKPVREEKKNALVESLEKQERWFTVDEVPDYLWHCPQIVFDMQKIPEAIKAIEDGKDLPGVIWHCADENEIAKAGDLVHVKCTIGVRVGYVVNVVYGEFDRIVALKERIGYKHLSPVIDVITNNNAKQITLKDILVVPDVKKVRMPANHININEIDDEFLHSVDPDDDLIDQKEE